MVVIHNEKRGTPKLNQWTSKVAPFKKKQEESIRSYQLQIDKMVSQRTERNRTLFSKLKSTQGSEGGGFQYDVI